MNRGIEILEKYQYDVFYFIFLIVHQEIKQQVILFLDSYLPDLNELRKRGLMSLWAKESHQQDKALAISVHLVNLVERLMSQA